MILDTSAVVAILQAEPELEPFARAVIWADHPAISAANWFEAATIVDHRGNDAARADFEAFFERFRVEIVSVSAAQARRAREAYRAFGKGNHPARLNFGDCFAYALARERDEPLLFKGNDFPRTDVKPAI